MLSILQNFLNDIFNKIQKGMENEGQEMKVKNAILQSLLQSLLEQLSQMTFNQMLPSMAQTIHTLRAQLGMSMLSQMFNQRQNQHASLFFRNFCTQSSEIADSNNQYNKKLEKFYHVFNRQKLKAAMSQWNHEYMSVYRI